jgi:predicted Zn-dependent protease with MMP-like domain
MTIEELEEQIEITVVHEIAHFLGISEERLAELGYG